MSPTQSNGFKFVTDLFKFVPNNAPQGTPDAINGKKQKRDILIGHLSIQLSYEDSNLDKQNQNLLCYHYTIRQSGRCIPFGKALQN